MLEPLIGSPKLPPGSRRLAAAPALPPVRRRHATTTRARGCRQREQRFSSQRRAPLGSPHPELGAPSPQPARPLLPAPPRGRPGPGRAPAPAATTSSRHPPPSAPCGGGRPGSATRWGRAGTAPPRPVSSPLPHKARPKNRDKMAAARGIT